MQYTSFLRISSIILTVAGVLGFLGLGPTANSSLLGSYLYFDSIQSIIHLLLAAITFAALMSKNEDVQRYITAAIGVITITVTAYSFYRLGAPTPNIYAINIEVPLESLVYLAYGLWALWVVLMPPGPIFVKDSDSESAA